MSCPGTRGAGEGLRRSSLAPEPVWEKDSAEPGAPNWGYPGRVDATSHGEMAIVMPCLVRRRWAGRRAGGRDGGRVNEDCN